MYVLVQVDDILVAANDARCKNIFFTELNDAYVIKDQGLLSNYLGIMINQNEDHFAIIQCNYTREILAKYGYLSARAVENPVKVNVHLTSAGEHEKVNTIFPYRQALECSYLSTSRRPDLAFGLRQFSWFVARPSSKHIGTVKQVLRYLAGTRDY